MSEPRKISAGPGRIPDEPPGPPDWLDARFGQPFWRSLPEAATARGVDHHALAGKVAILVDAKRLVEALRATIDQATCAGEVVTREQQKRLEQAQADLEDAAMRLGHFVDLDQNPVAVLPIETDAPAKARAAR